MESALCTTTAVYRKMVSHVRSVCEYRLCTEGRLLADLGLSHCKIVRQCSETAQKGSERSDPTEAVTLSSRVRSMLVEFSTTAYFPTFDGVANRIRSVTAVETKTDVRERVHGFQRPLVFQKSFIPLRDFAIG